MLDQRLRRDDRLVRSVGNRARLLAVTAAVALVGLSACAGSAAAAPPNSVTTEGSCSQSYGCADPNSSTSATNANPPRHVATSQAGPVAQENDDGPIATVLVWLAAAAAALLVIYGLFSGAESPSPSSAPADFMSYRARRRRSSARRDASSLNVNESSATHLLPNTRRRDNANATTSETGARTGSPQGHQR